MIPDSYKLLYSSTEIAARVKSLAVPISRWVSTAEEQTGSDVVAVPLLRGGVFFYADLVREIDSSIELSPVRASAYLGKAGNTPTSAVHVDIEDFDISGRAILLIDDVCDTGRTLQVLAAGMKERGAAEVRSAVLVKRDIPAAFEPDWWGFKHNGSEWFVGYGMDDKDRHRNLRSIYTIKQ